MGIISHGVALGLGYACARPEGRRRLLVLRDQMLQLARRNEVTQLRDRAWHVATSKVMTANVSLAQKARRGSGNTGTAPVAGAADVAAGVGLDAALAGRAGNRDRTATPEQPAERRP